MIFNTSLGLDFWKFRIGQLVSLLGDSCGSIALAWWVLDKTGSAASMSTVIAPAMLVKVILLPLLGPIADKFDRKNLILFSDLWRFIFSFLLVIMIYSDNFNLVGVTVIYSLISIGSAVFSVAASPIVAQIVKPEHLQMAAQQSQTINSFAGIIGGILGGIIVTNFGVGGAFLFDSATYIIAAVMTFLIKANTKPEKKENITNSSAYTKWKNELKDGFTTLYKIPVLFWLCIVAMFLNLALSPLGIVLPVLAKESREMPPWFLGGLESSISLGAIAGAISLSLILKKVKTHYLFVISIMMIGIGVVLLPWTPNILLPLTVLFWIGIGSTWANIPLGTQISLAVPNHYLGRIGSIMNFMCTGIAPLGVALSGFIIAQLGLTNALLCMGSAVILLTPMILLIPQIGPFMNAPPEKAKLFFEKNFPNTFK